MRRDDVVGEQFDLRIVSLQCLIVLAALDGDAVFRARQLVLQPQEILVGSQLRIVLRRPPAGARARPQVDRWPAIFSAGVRAPAIAARASAMFLKTSVSCAAKPFTVSTRLGIRSARRCSATSTCAHAAFTASRCVTRSLRTLTNLPHAPTPMHHQHENDDESRFSRVSPISPIRSTASITVEIPFR